MIGYQFAAIGWMALGLWLYAIVSHKPSPTPQGEPAADEGLSAGPGAVEASPGLPRPVWPFTSCEECGQLISDTEAARYGGWCRDCNEDDEIEAGWVLDD